MIIELNSKCKNSHAQYEIYKADKEKIERRLLEDAATKKKEAENQDKLAEIERDIGVLPNGIKIAEKIIKEGNEEDHSRLLKVLNRDELTQSNMKVATGVKRKHEVSLEIRELGKKRAKLDAKLEALFLIIPFLALFMKIVLVFFFCSFFLVLTFTY